MPNIDKGIVPQAQLVDRLRRPPPNGHGHLPEACDPWAEESEARRSLEIVEETLAALKEPWPEPGNKPDAATLCLCKLITSCRSLEEVNEADTDPHRLARLYYKACQFPDPTIGLGVPILRHYQGQFHRWDGSAWVVLKDQEARAHVVAVIKGEFDSLNLKAIKNWRNASRKDDKGKLKPKPVAHTVTTKLISDVMQSLMSLAMEPATTPQPSWLRVADWHSGNHAYHGRCHRPGHVLPCKNGLLLLDPGDKPPELMPPTPRFFSPNALDYEYDRDAPSPVRWHQFLGEILPNDPQAVQTLQEWFGYCLLPDTRQQKILMLVGPTRSGKGTVSRVLQNLVGRANTVSPTLASLGTNFGLAPFLGKTLATISDARISSKTDLALVIERLLSISGEDAQTVDRKFLSHVTCPLTTRFMLLTNELPRLPDTSKAVTGRMLVLRFTQQFYGKEDTSLTDKLLEELPGILLWALEGWRGLQARGHFTQPDSGKELITTLEDLSSPVGAFLRDSCEIGPNYSVPVADLYTAWCAWCVQNGKDHPGPSNVFSRDLHSALPSVQTKQKVTSNKGKRSQVRCHFGLRIKPLAV